jgi:hypothetical protein
LWTKFRERPWHRPLVNAMPNYAMQRSRER